MKISKRVENVKFSGIGNIVKLANSIGGDLLRFEIGDVGYKPPSHVGEVLEQAFQEGKTHYPPFQGNPELLTEIVNRVSEFNGLNIGEEQVLVTTGGSISLYVALASLIDEGDEVITTDTIWCHIPEMVRMLGGVPRLVQLDNATGKIDLDMLGDMISDKTAALVINTPHNPTGHVLTEEQAEGIAKILGEKEIPVISDEEYEAFTYDNWYHLSIGRFYENTISIHSFSKSFAMSGFRVGFLVAPKGMMESLSKAFLYTQMYPSLIMQEAALAALRSPSAYSVGLKKEYQERMETAHKAFSTIPGFNCKRPAGSVYMWVDIRETNMSSEECANHLIRNAGVVTVPGSVFGENGEGYLRISLFENKERTEEAVKRIKQAL